VCFTSLGEFVVYSFSTPTSPERVESWRCQVDQQKSHCHSCVISLD